MAKRNFRIETPRGSVSTKGARSELVWNTNFVPKYITRYTLAQAFIDNEVLRRSEPYTPLLTGTLIKTGILGTEVGSGFVQWIAPYAAAQYYRARKAGSVTGTEVGSVTGPLRGPFWFERMKAVDGNQIIAGARRFVGTGKAT